MATIQNVSMYLDPVDRSLSPRTSVLPTPGRNEVLLEISCTGVCGTDVHFWSTGESAGFKVNQPTVLGHESCGKVVLLGPGVTNLKNGDRVAIEISQPCCSCEFCLGGRYNLCPNLKAHGLPPHNGLYTRYFVHDASFCHRLPDNVTNEEGAMVEPLSVAIYACQRGNVSAGDCVLVCGAGPIGLLTMLVANALGAAKVLITDVRQDRLDFAKKTLKSKYVLQVGEKSERQTATEIRNLLGQAPPVTIDCCGSEKSLRTSIMATRSGGVVVIVGLGKNEMKLPIVEAAVREIDIRGIYLSPNCYRKSIAMIASGKLDVKSLITHRFKLVQLSKALKTADKQEGAIKVMVMCQE